MHSAISEVRSNCIRRYLFETARMEYDASEDNKRCPSLKVETLKPVGLKRRTDMLLR
jgi:hypothetical protein